LGFPPRRIHRWPDYYRWKKTENFTPDHLLLAYVNKNKGGPVGQVKLHFDGDRQAVTDWADGGSNASATDDGLPFQS
jgi:hypothetical protein